MKELLKPRLKGAKEQSLACSFEVFYKIKPNDEKKRDVLLCVVILNYHNSHVSTANHEILYKVNF